MAKGKIFIASTLAADVLYRTFAKTDGDVPVQAEGVLIKGGAGVADKRLETLKTLPERGMRKGGMHGGPDGFVPRGGRAKALEGMTAPVGASGS